MRSPQPTSFATNQQNLMAWKDSKTTGVGCSCIGLPMTSEDTEDTAERATPAREWYELWQWRLKLAMSQSRHRTCGFLMTVDSTCHLPPPRSGDSAAAGPRLLICQACHPLISQLASISEGCSPIRHLGTRLNLGPCKQHHTIAQGT